ncbi:MAG: CCA tRNA nucleotidyltransferase [Chloroflexia bacterium]
MITDPNLLRAHFYAGLPPGLADLVREVAAEVRARGTPVYLVGGAVRDLALGSPALDLDLVVEGSAIALAEQIAARYALPITRHTTFGTATLALHGEFAPPPPAKPALDFVTARREVYPAPGRLPQVEAADIAADLARRDFTINAMALPVREGDLLDPHGGMADLEAGRIRALHRGSFRDDPTRIFRAARYAARFAFEIEPGTAVLIVDALAAGMVALLTPARLHQELLRTLAEATPAPALVLLQQLGALAAVEPALTWDTSTRDAFACTADPALRLALLVYRLPPEARARIVARLGLDPRPVAELAALDAVAPQMPDAGPAEAVALLRPVSDRVLDLYRCLASAPVAGVIARYREEWQHVRPLLTGDDLREMGIPPGPRYREILAALLTARLEGRVSSREDEVETVGQFVRSA